MMGSRLEANSDIVRKRIQSHAFNGEEGEEYEASHFGGFADYFRRKKLKLQNRDADIRANSEDNPPIFRGVVAHVNGYTQPSLNDIHHLVVSHGGGFLQYLDGKTSATHIIASSLTPKKREEFRKYRIVKPAWVVESVKAGRLLPWDQYRVVDEGNSQKVLKYENGQLQNQTNAFQHGYKDQTDSSWYTSQVKDAATEAQNSPNVLPPSQNETVSIPADLNLSVDTDYGDFPSMGSLPDVIDSTNTAVLQSNKTIERKPSDTKNLLGSHPKLSVEDSVVSAGTQLVQETIPVKPNMTSEEYNALLLSDPRMRNSSVVNPEFLQQYYRESRLHHLSTWKAELKAKLQAAAQVKAQNNLKAKSRAIGSRRYILHVDFDSFFAAVSIQKHHPEFIEKPVAIAHGTGSGSEIASCNYPARAFGIKNGMWMKGALEKCPELKVLPYDFPAYEEASRQFYDCILAIDGLVQSVSIDEALLDVTTQCLQAGGSNGSGISEGSLYREQFKADEIANTLRNAIKDRTGCAVSVGIGGNILQAKVALRKAKPAGQYQLKPDEVLEFIGSLTVKDLPGVAYSLGGKLEELGVKLVKDIRDLSKERLTSHLGPKTGAKLWDYSRGIDKTEVGLQTIRKSVSAEINWGIRFVNQGQAEEFVQSLSDELHRRLVENLVKGKQLTIRVMRRSADAPLEPVKHLGHGKCDVFNKSVLLGVATNASDIIGKEAIAMLRSFGFTPGDLRGLGVQMTKLEPVKSMTGDLPSSSQRQLNFKSSPSAKRTIQEIDTDLIESPHKGDEVSIDAAEVLDNRPTFDPSHRPLNLSGTQFIMPSQPDPKVVAELPADIRSMLVHKPKVRETSPSPASRRQAQGSQQLPPQSQLDPDILEALPDDIRSEILGYYSRPSNDSGQGLSKPNPLQAEQQVQPLSSRLEPTNLTVKKETTPTKKRRGRPPKASLAAKSHYRSTLAQSTFSFGRPRSAENVSTEGSRQASPTSDETDEISEEFLAALPEDIRREVLEEQRHKRMRQQYDLIENPMPSERANTSTEPNPLTLENRIQLPPRPEKPTFTSKKLSDLSDLRQAISAWYEAFASENPFSEDVDALALYLKQVVLEERDLEKAVSVVDWLCWLIQDSAGGAAPKIDEISEEPSKSSQSEMTWSQALQTIQNGVTAAFEERGLPPPSFSL
ncbi:putative DNA damage repair protein Mus42 [Talaromyces proteolyticus]|uniref:DNA repair protein REV1 n=1 Tax=Talaromyces proteolyticus TaxID=1131652 RepID=A0AAD4Q3B0_9EURO|nr:putative DNA damage repair protein Mus42 [Talaromyces proteolyticus]KAH8704889.1 putative DNA damage repair protein Mus42 [Talaromyces proteolyticus]